MKTIKRIVVIVSFVLLGLSLIPNLLQNTVTIKNTLDTDVYITPIGKNAGDYTTSNIPLEFKFINLISPFNRSIKIKSNTEETIVYDQEICILTGFVIERNNKLYLVKSEEPNHIQILNDSLMSDLKPDPYLARYLNFDWARFIKFIFQIVLISIGPILVFWSHIKTLKDTQP